jgi:hypothetical protein
MLRPMKFLVFPLLLSVALLPTMSVETSMDASNLENPKYIGRTVEVTNLASEDDEFPLRFFSSTEPMPLVVDLHQWSSNHNGSFGNDKRLDLTLLGRNWNYVRPNLGSNRTPEGCCSPLAIGRLKTAIAFAKENGNVLDDQVYIVGASGGGYLALCGLMNDIEGVAGYDIWVPISDLAAWHDQTRGTAYAESVRACTGSPEQLDIAEAHRRSPLFMSAPSHIPPTRIYTGIRDGWQGTVPISQSVRMYNRLAADMGSPQNAISDAQLLDLLENRGEPGFLPGDGSFFRHEEWTTGNVTLTIFEGTHEGFTSVALDDIEEQWRQGAAETLTPPSGS